MVNDPSAAISIRARRMSRMGHLIDAYSLASSGDGNDPAATGW